MADTRFDYPSIVAVKILVKKDDSVLLIKEPMTNEWKPGKLGFPGGKLMLNESVLDAATRKIQSDIGMEIDIKGILKIYDILMPEKNVYHIVLLANYKSGEIILEKLEPDNIVWYKIDNALKMKVGDFTEYYNLEVIKLALESNPIVASLELIKVQDNRTQELTEWMKQ